MAKNGYSIFDSDMHIMEPADLWQRYIDPKFKHVAPVGLERHRRDLAVRVKDIVIPNSGNIRKPGKVSPSAERQHEIYAFAEERGWDPPSQLQAMDREGIEVAVLFPTRGLFVLGLDAPETAGVRGLEPDLAAAIAHAYNDWLADFCQENPKRLIGAAMVAPHDVEGAVVETRRCVERFGFKSIFLLPGCVRKRPWHHPYYDPLWRECERLNVAVGFHEGGLDYLTPDFGFADVLATHPGTMYHIFSHPVGPMFALVTMTVGGVFKRFPNLRAGFLEGNCSWAPWIVYRMNEHYEWLGSVEAPELKMKPSEYYKRNCYVSVEADEEPARWYFEALGDDNVLFSSDYPHPDAKFPNSVENFLRLPFRETTKRKVLWDNCVRFYNLAG